MIDGSLCRAARALLNWSQADLAARAHVSLGTVKNFESTTRSRTPVRNNLMAIEVALKRVGIEFLSDNDGNTGVVMGRVRWGAYIPGEKLNMHVRIADAMFHDAQAEPGEESHDQEFEIWLAIDERALEVFAGRLLAGDADARQIAQDNRSKILGAVRQKVSTYDLRKSPGPIMIGIEDLFFP